MKQKLSVLEYELPVIVEPLPEGGYLARSKKLQGALAEGKTIAQALANLVDVASQIIDIRREEGIAIPLGKKKVSRLPHTFSLPLPYALS